MGTAPAGKEGRPEGGSLQHSGPSGSHAASPAITVARRVRRNQAGNLRSALGNCPHLPPTSPVPALASWVLKRETAEHLWVLTPRVQALKPHRWLLELLLLLVPMAAASRGTPMPPPISRPAAPHGWTSPSSGGAHTQE